MRERPDADQQLPVFYGNLMILRLILAVMTGMITITAAWLTGRPILMIGAIALNSVGLVMHAVQGSSNAMLSGFERIDLGAAPIVIGQVVFISLGAYALFSQSGYIGLILANLVSIALVTFIIFRRARGLGLRLGRPAPGTWTSLLRASLPFGVITFALGFSYRFDTVLLNLFRSDAEVGYYNAAYNLVFSFTLLSNVINTSLYPSLSRQSVNDPGSLNSIYERVMRYLLVVAFPITVGVFLTADLLVPLLFRESYQQAIPALQILIWAVPLMYMSEFLGYIVVISNKESRVARAVLISTGINVVVNLVLVRQYGYVAAALMTVITEAILVGQYVWLLRAQLSHMNWNRTLIRPLLAVMTMGIAVVLLHEVTPVWLTVSAGALVYVSMLLVLGTVGREELRFVRSLRQPVAS